MSDYVSGPAEWRALAEFVRDQTSWFPQSTAERCVKALLAAAERCERTERQQDAFRTAADEAERQDDPAAVARWLLASEERTAALMTVLIERMPPGERSDAEEIQAVLGRIEEKGREIAAALAANRERMAEIERRQAQLLIRPESAETCPRCGGPATITRCPHLWLDCSEWGGRCPDPFGLNADCAHVTALPWQRPAAGDAGGGEGGKS
jgi:hypothetical protein